MILMKKWNKLELVSFITTMIQGPMNSIERNHTRSNTDQTVEELYEAELNVTFEMLDEIESEAKERQTEITILAMPFIHYTFV